MPPTAHKGVAFFEKAGIRGAGAFGAQFKNLAMSEVARMGHAFRLVQQDPTATSLAETMVAVKIGPVPERVVGKRDFLPASYLELGARRPRTVRKIEAKGVDYEGQPGEWFGTGFLVSKNLLLTNHHVLNSIETRDELAGVASREGGQHRQAGRFETGQGAHPLQGLGPELLPLFLGGVARQDRVEREGSPGFGPPSPLSVSRRGAALPPSSPTADRCAAL